MRSSSSQRSIPVVLAFALTSALGAALGIPALGIAGEAIPLTNSVVVSGHVAAGLLDLSVPGSTLFYSVFIPPGTEVLEVRVGMENGDADLFAGPVMSLDPADYPFISDSIGLYTEGGPIDQGSFPPLGAYETWYFAVHGYYETDFIIIASWGSADPATILENGMPVSDRVQLGLDILVYPESTKYYSVDIGEDAQELSVSLTNLSGDADLYVGRVLNASPNYYDFYSQNLGTNPEIINVNSTTIPVLGASRVWYIAVHGFEASDFTLTVTWGSAAQAGFLRGDCNRDFAIDISDPIAHVATLFLAKAAPCLAACDSNGDGLSDLTDPVYTLEFLYLSGLPPPGPYPSCGYPAQAPALGCDVPSCGQ